MPSKPIQRLLQDIQDLSEFLLDIRQSAGWYIKQSRLNFWFLPARGALGLGRILRRGRFHLPAALQMFAGSGNGEAFLVEQVLDVENQLDILAPIKAMPGAGFLGAQRREFSFPEPQHVGLDARQARDLTYPEIQLVGDLRLAQQRIAVGSSLGGELGFRVLGGVRLAHESTLILMSPIAGIHPVREALRSGRPMDRVLIAKGAGGARLQEIIDLCRQHGVPIRYEPRDRLNRAAGHSSHQGVVGYGSAGQYAELSQTGKAGGLHVILDGVEDPHNLGAIVRTAHAAGATAVVIPERRAAGITDTVTRAAAGALAYLPVVRVTNVVHAIEELKQRGYWIYGLDERGAEVYDQVAFHAPTAIVLGAEGKGLHQNVARHCDFLVSIPMSGGQVDGQGVASLNVSVAAGVVLFEWRRRTGQTVENSQ